MNQKRIMRRFWREDSTTAWRVVFFLILFFSSFSLFFAMVNPVSAASLPVISGHVYADLNTNGNLDLGEAGLAGRVVSLLRDQKVILSVKSDENGDFQILAPAIGKYSVLLEKVAGWESTAPANISLDLGITGQENLNFGAYQTVKTGSPAWAPIMSLSDIKVRPLDQTSVEISWFSNQPATGQVIYGTKPMTGQDMSVGLINFGYENASAVDFKAGTYHVIKLSGLKPGTKYFFRAVSLPDPNQWRDSAHLLSAEYEFGLQDGSGAAGTVAPLTPPTDKVNANTVIKKPPVKNNSGRVLAGESEVNGPIGGQAQPADEVSSKEGLLAEMNGTDDLVKNSAPDCLWPIIILILLNLAAMVGVWHKSEKINDPVQKKLWWICLILVVVPTVLAFPECWLNFWLCLTLLVSVIYLVLPAGKPGDKAEADINSPFNQDNQE